MVEYFMWTSANSELFGTIFWWVVCCKKVYWFTLHLAAILQLFPFLWQERGLSVLSLLPFHSCCNYDILSRAKSSCWRHLDVLSCCCRGLSTSSAAFICCCMIIIYHSMRSKAHSWSKFLISRSCHAYFVIWNKLTFMRVYICMAALTMMWGNVLNFGFNWVYSKLANLHFLFLLKNLYSIVFLTRMVQYFYIIVFKIQEWGTRRIHVVCDWLLQLMERYFWYL